MIRIKWTRLIIGALMLGLLFNQGCKKRGNKEYTPQDVVLDWAKMSLFVTQYTPSNSPTFASRGFGYIGLTMYESVVNGYSNYQSMAGQLNGLEELPKPLEGKKYSWELTLNAAQASILRNIYKQTSDANKIKIDSLEQAVFEYYSDLVDDKETIERSKAYGQEVANTIFEWSKTDGGHRGYLKNFEKMESHPTKPGSWQPPLFAQAISHNPLHPNWGRNRTFVKNNSDLPLPQIIAYDTVKGSPYYQEFEKVYEKDLQLTQDEKEAAIWWGDDPDVTFTPPGHSFYLATLAMEEVRPELIRCTEIYAKVGMSVADAFINCWKWKYHFFSERPNTFIPKYIDPEWESFWPDPPFPAFPSGHAIQAAAAATVLERSLGTTFPILDKAHLGRERDEIRDVDFVPRSFNSFWEVAQETADSRFYGGIHTAQDNKVGLEEGVKIGTNVDQLNWTKK